MAWPAMYAGGGVGGGVGLMPIADATRGHAM